METSTSEKWHQIKLNKEVDKESRGWRQPTRVKYKKSEGEKN